MPDPNPSDMTDQQIIDEIAADAAKIAQFKGKSEAYDDMGQEALRDAALDMIDALLDRIADLVAELKAR